ncbi:MAG: cell division protein FtsX [Flavobacteriaceae bacterium]|nr:MAG: cell division protein FtsX [Flavobacteriaceae bacterium]
MVISIALILFLLGIFGIIVINSKQYFDYLKEQLTVEVFFKEVLDQRDMGKEVAMHKNYISGIQKHKFIKKVQYISKENAAVIAKRELAIATDDIFEENIFPASAEITLKSEFVNPKTVDSIKTILRNSPIVEDVVNDNELMTSVYRNISKITMWIIGFSILLLLIVIVLINNSIRLRIFSKRFLIKTMRLVGARRRFIIMPFVKTSAWLGFFGALLAILALTGCWYYFTQYINAPFVNNQYLLLLLVLIVTGIGIAVLSTALSTWNFLKLKTDELYTD